MPAGRRYAPPGSRLAEKRPRHSPYDGAAQSHNGDGGFNFKDDPKKAVEAFGVLSQGLGQIRRLEQQRKAEREQMEAGALKLKRRRTRSIVG